MNDRHFTHFYIAGFTYYEGVDVFNKLKIGTELSLKQEPDNNFDNYAVALFYKDTKLGYIPKNSNKEISKFLQMGYNNLFEAKINQVSSNEHPEQQIGVVIKIKQKSD